MRSFLFILFTHKRRFDHAIKQIYGGALACANSNIQIVDSVFSGNRALSVQVRVSLN
jgi:hypothetical protein